jgi:molecular chaperone DnaK
MNINPAPIGIDLGTTNSVISTAINGEFEIIENNRGDRRTPSVVSYDADNDSVLVGKEAENRLIMYPEQTIKSVKRYMGEKEEFTLGSDSYRPEEISALILKKLIQDAESTLDRDLPSAVITVPAYFSERERKATKKAAEIAGLEVDRIIPEPTAACLAYGLQTAERKQIFVYDLGGGTFDVSVVTISEGVVDVKGVDGHTDLGGDDYDGLIVGWLEEQIKQKHNASPALEQPEIESRLFEAAKDAKHELSSRSTTTITLPHLELADGSVASIEQTLDKETFAEIARGPTEETLGICDSLLNELKIGPEYIDDVILVGGSTRMDIVQDAVKDYFGTEPKSRINPDQVVSLGATIQACIINDHELPTAKTTNVVPTREFRNQETALVSDDSNTVLFDVLPQSIGVSAYEPGTENLQYLPLLPKGESIPAEAQTNIMPHTDYQTSTKVEVYQGDSRSLIENTKIDEFTLGPYPPKRKENQDHRIKISVDSDGIIHVVAIDEQHNVRDDIQVEGEFELTENEVEQMQRTLPELTTT